MWTLSCRQDGAPSHGTPGSMQCCRESEGYNLPSQDSVIQHPHSPLLLILRHACTPLQPIDRHLRSFLEACLNPLPSKRWARHTRTRVQVSRNSVFPPQTFCRAASMPPIFEASCTAIEHCSETNNLSTVLYSIVTSPLHFRMGTSFCQALSSLSCAAPPCPRPPPSSSSKGRHFLQRRIILWNAHCRKCTISGAWLGGTLKLR